jgi:hypothetical protein
MVWECTECGRAKRWNVQRVGGGLSDVLCMGESSKVCGRAKQSNLQRVGGVSKGMYCIREGEAKECTACGRVKQCTV